ncbi:NUDIX hydrolase [Planktotalea sp.]|uniref:NUDIX hydrolase n=1 Tax=Planktotalea sp. TaxID=2029877 RepID=UPI003297B3CC
MESERAFGGAKIILHCDGALVTHLRDDIPSIPFPNMWDLPGGGAEGSETPKGCALRETFEEYGLKIEPKRINWGRRYASLLRPNTDNWFFAAPITPEDIANIVFGEEGQYWQMMSFESYITHQNAVPHLQSQVRDFLAEEI